MKIKAAMLAVVCTLILSGCANGNNSGQNIPSTSGTSQPQAGDTSVESPDESPSEDPETDIEEGSKESPDEDPAEAALSQYLFKCADENGNPVSDVKLQVCTEESCSMLVSADDGTVVFDGDPFAYSVHVSAPEGYEIVSEKEFTTLEEYSEYTLEFKSK